MQNYVTNPHHIDPHELQIGFADELRFMLQKHVGNDGYWAVGYTHPPVASPILIDADNTWDRLVMFWMDEDADVQFSIDYVRPFIELINEGGDYFIQKAAEAHKAWSVEYGRKAIKSDMAIKDSQITKPTISSLH